MRYDPAELIRLLEQDRPEHIPVVRRSKFEQALDVYRSKIVTFANNNIGKFPGTSIEDLTQEITVVLWTCVDKYDPNKAAGFSTFFWTAAKHRMIDMIKRINCEKRRSEFFILPDYITSLGDTNVHSIDASALSVVIDKYMTEASAEDWAIIHEEIVDKWEDLPIARRRRISGVA